MRNSFRSYTSSVPSDLQGREGASGLVRETGEPANEQRMPRRTENVTDYWRFQVILTG